MNGAGLEENKEEKNISANTNRPGTAGLITKPTFAIYPNPVKDVVNVHINGEGTVTLTDQSGKIILVKAININGVINVSALTAGVYYLKSNTTPEVKKIIVTK